MTRRSLLEQTSTSPKDILNISLKNISKKIVSESSCMLLLPTDRPTKLNISTFNKKVQTKNDDPIFKIQTIVDNINKLIRAILFFLLLTADRSYQASLFALIDLPYSTPSGL